MFKVISNLYFMGLILLKRDKFIQIAVTDSLAKALERNEQLRIGCPDGNIPARYVEDITKNMAESTDNIRIAMIGSFFAVTLTAILAILCSTILKLLNITLSTDFIAAIRFLAACLLFWSFWGKVGWEIQSYDGDSLPEIINICLTKYLYLSGVFCMLISLA